jgi:hypothetical protein
MKEEEDEQMLDCGNLCAQEVDGASDEKYQKATFKCPAGEPHGGIAPPPLLNRIAQCHASTIFVFHCPRRGKDLNQSIVSIGIAGIYYLTFS